MICTSLSQVRWLLDLNSQAGSNAARDHEGRRVAGEIGFYLGHKRTAAVVADEPSIVYRMSASALQEMEKNDPEPASVFHQIIVDLLAERVTHLINVVNALQR